MSLGLNGISGSYHGVEIPRHFFIEDSQMKCLSVFVDESGSFGPYELHSPYYIVSLLLHNQSNDIKNDIALFTKKMTDLDLPEFTVHSGPLIRREFEYKELLLLDRKRIFNTIYNFTRAVDIKYHSIVVEKRQLIDEMDLVDKLTKQLSVFLRNHIETFISYDKIIVYYDYGQKELAKILVSIFNAITSNVEYRKVAPADYLLFQATDMICMLELLAMKSDRKDLSNSEIAFFGSSKNLRKSYLRAIQKKRF